MNATTAAMLQVPGAKVYYEVRGDGPLLIIGQSGEGDAHRTADLVDRLAGHYTVVTYDRRGLSRTAVDDPSLPVTPAMHAEDVHHLLAELTDEPALMLGCSLGALYGLHLAAAHPGQLSALIAHDPATPGLLSAADRADIERRLGEIEDLYRTGGWRAAVPAAAALTGLDPARIETEAGVVAAPMTEERAANFGYYLANDIPQCRMDTLGPAEVAAAAAHTRIIPAAGKDSKKAWNHQCAVELSALLGRPIEEFPGGHNGNTSFPTGFAARVRELFTTSS
ncbi:alpha/beta fold hydrolase [Actinomadura sp. NTSP31]|uniref:alpha/beta fold hydrolase n=1 Tax=Actinomadura sp. NTSP31 TaxID=1735447 RepID=UPI0035C1D2B5